jgi:hypothetical protein
MLNALKTVLADNLTLAGAGLALATATVFAASPVSAFAPCDDMCQDHYSGSNAYQCDNGNTPEYVGCSVDPVQLLITCTFDCS